MRVKKTNWSRDGGWTLIEAILSIVIMSIMVLGLTIVLMAFKEHLDRSWAIRVMDQYGNDVVEELTHELRNAVDVSVRNGIGDTHEITIHYLDPYYLDRTSTKRWKADLRTTQIKVDNRPVDPTFPPRDLGRGESYAILQFTLYKFGKDPQCRNEEENRDATGRRDAFLDATYDIRFKLGYIRKAINPGEYNWDYEKEYHNRVYIRNKNLPIRAKVAD